MKNGVTLYLHKPDISVTFKKLTNRKWYEFSQKYAPIFEDWDFVMLLNHHHYPKTKFDLSKMYMALFSLFGAQNAYDEYKCSFAYRFELKLKRGKKKSTYGLALMDIKGNMPYFTYYRKPLEGENPDAYQKTIEAEFSAEEMRQCTLAFLVFLEDIYRAYKSFFNQPFYRINPAAYLIYGFEEGEFFNDFYPSDSEEDYENFKKKMDEYKQNKVLNTSMSKY